jgi:hypothetical protein
MSATSSTATSIKEELEVEEEQLQDERVYDSNEDEYDEEYEEETDSDDDNDDPDEPKLRYRRVGASVKELLDKDTASTLRVSDKFVVTFENTSKAINFFA